MAQFTPALIFSDNMVLQVGKPIRVFGSGFATVTGTFLGETAVSVPTADGWLLTFSAHSYGNGYSMTLTDGNDTITYTGIAVGEVLLCSGQSNMQLKLGEIPHTDTYTEDADMRLFQCARPECADPILPTDGWVSAKNENIMGWSVIAYYFAKIARENGVPCIGMIICAQGASNIQSWIDEKKFVGSPLDLPLNVMHNDAAYELYQKWNKPGLLYHAMFLPVSLYAVAGVLWYQGESNASEAEGAIYLELLRSLTTDWRDASGDAALPFYIVQIADFIYQATPGWKAVQKAQMDAQDALPHVRTVVCSDFSEKDMIHPITKEPLARRLFEAMRADGNI